MRTTVDIPDKLHRELKARAALDGKSVKEVLIGLIEREVGDPEGRRVALPLIRGKGKRKIDVTREQIDEAMFG